MTTTIENPTPEAAHDAIRRELGAAPKPVVDEEQKHDTGVWIVATIFFGLLQAVMYGGPVFLFFWLVGGDLAASVAREGVLGTAVQLGIGVGVFGLLYGWLKAGMHWRRSTR